MAKKSNYDGNGTYVLVKYRPARKGSRWKKSRRGTTFTKTEVDHLASNAGCSVFRHRRTRRLRTVGTWCK